MADELDSTTASTAVLKALANPIRRAVLQALVRLESARATDLARELALPANKLSFHLRALADAGLIREDPALARDKRDRVWVPAPRNITLGGPNGLIQDEALGASALRGVADDHLALVNRVMAWSLAHMNSRTMDPHALLIRATSHLTPDEFAELNREINALLKRAEEAHNPAAEDTRFYEIDIVAANDTV